MDAVLVRERQHHRALQVMIRQWPEQGPGEQDEPRPPPAGAHDGDGSNDHQREREQSEDGGCGPRLQPGRQHPSEMAYHWASRMSEVRDGPGRPPVHLSAAACTAAQSVPGDRYGISW